MFFAVLTFFAALSIETLGTIISVIGLSTLFGGNPIIVAMAVSLDVGKVVVVSLMYKYWRQLTIMMKTYGLLALVVTMTITSAGAAGYLSGEFQKAITNTQEGELRISVLQEEQLKLEQRKKQIDDQIANLPSNYSRSRITLMREFESEQKAINSRLAQISQELPELKIQQIGTEAKAGPIMYISKAFDVPVEEAVKWVILMIIFVFDPLAVFLIIAGNFLLEVRAGRTTRSPPVPHQEAPEPPREAEPPLVPDTTPAAVSSTREAPVRREITIQDVRPPKMTTSHRSGLTDVQADESVKFDSAPPAKILGSYNDLK